MKIICQTGLIITSDDIDIINDRMKDYYEKNFTEEREFINADVFFNKYLGCKLISGHTGNATDIFDGTPKTIDGYPLEDLLYFYIVPLDKTAKLIRAVYADNVEIIREVKSKLFKIKRFLPPSFDFEERLAHIEIAVEDIIMPTIEEEWARLMRRSSSTDMDEILK